MFDQVDCVSDPAGEIITTLKERTKLHKAVILLNHQGHHEEKEKMFHDILPRDDLWDDPSVNPLINIMKNYVKRRKSFCSAKVVTKCTMTGMNKPWDSNGHAQMDLSLNLYN